MSQCTPSTTIILRKREKKRKSINKRKMRQENHEFKTAYPTQQHPASNK
jgi:hypothetical protein